MADTKTAAEWREVAANARQQSAELNKQRTEAGASAEAAVAAAQVEYERLKRAALSDNFQPLEGANLEAFKTASNAATSYKNNELMQAQQALNNATVSYTAQINTLNFTASNADRQAAIAESGPPNTQENTPPANPDPGSNTAVTTTPPPAADAPAPVSGVQPTPDPNQSQAETNRLNAISAPEPQPEILAEGKEEKAPPSAQDVIDAKTDPFEKRRMELAQRNDTPASAQDVIDAEEDPFERERMAAAQRSTNEVPVPQPEPDPNEYQAETNRLKAAEAAARAAEENQSPAETARLKAKSITVAQANARSGATAQDQTNFYQTGDWRVRLSLAPESQYLYNLKDEAGILAPLKATNGVIFPYTPNISVSYHANYDSTDVTQSNYKIYQYKNSSVENISISCDFTAQDTYEATYLLAVIHFFKTVTKMFYGKDENPKPGTPPPLCYLTGLGAFQFDKHPLAITSFTYNLPIDVDYIRAGSTTTPAGVNKSDSQPKNVNTGTNGRANNIGSGGTPEPPKFKNVNGGSVEPTYVPTKIQLTINAYPIMSRSVISREFSLKQYGTGILLRGSDRKTGGIW